MRELLCACRITAPGSVDHRPGQDSARWLGLPEVWNGEQSESAVLLWMPARRPLLRNQGGEEVSAIIAVASAALIAYQLGYLRGWDRGFKEGNELGEKYGRVAGVMEFLTKKYGPFKEKTDAERK